MGTGSERRLKLESRLDLAWGVLCEQALPRLFSSLPC
jgi:hypothetical protein